MGTEACVSPRIPDLSRAAFPPMKRVLIPLLLASLSCLWSSITVTAAEGAFPAIFNTEKTPGGPMPAAEAARTTELPPGFSCKVFAAEPDVQQPIAMAWDARGRLWIAECYTYAENPDRWNTNLRDRILIFEDTDGDGHFDKRTVFWDEGVRLTSIEMGDGGVYALCAPNLIFIPDKKGDDVPDGPAEVMLDGFNYKTIGHNIVNGLRWGPDGWLYGRHGITDTSSIGAPGTPEKNRTRMNCGIFRWHPVTRKFEVVLQGGTNSWGADWDANGELFWINTVIGHLWHGIAGSYAKRMFGAHLNPHAYELIDQTADHYHFDNGTEKWSDVKKGISSKTDELGGGHAHVGCVIYNGSAWPKEYMGRLFTCNLHGNRINMDILERQGCGYVGKHGADFMKSKDKWFRGIDLSTGPDGNVYVIDWSDAGECHDSDGVHRTSGRIYKISHGEAKPRVVRDLNREQSLVLAHCALEEDSWLQQQARLALARRGNAATGDHGQAIDFLTNGTPTSYRSMAALASMGALRKATLEGALRSTDEHVRAFAVDLVAGGNASDGTPELPTDDPSGLVRLHLAGAMQRLPLDARFPLARALASHAEDANDPQQPLMIWYGIEAAAAQHPDKAIALALSSKIPKVRRLIARRLTEEIANAPGPVDDLIAAALQGRNTDAHEDIVRGMSEALKGFRQVARPPHWDDFANATGQRQPELMREIALVFGSGRAVDELVALIKETNGDANARRSAFDSLLRSPKPEHFAITRSMISDKVLGAAARLGLAKFSDTDVPNSLLANWPDRSQEWRAANVTTLVSRAAWAKELLAFVAKHPAARQDITPFHARQIRAFGDEELNRQLTKVWGEMRDTPEAKKQELARWQTLLTADALAKGDVGKGRALFNGLCAACHKMYGEGAAIAPELTGSDRHNLNYLLENIVDPNAIVPADYRMTIVKLKGGRTLGGVIPEQNDRIVTVQTPTERATIQRSDIAEMEQLSQSFMPEGLLAALGEENAKHLIAYLMDNGQVPLPRQ